MGVNFLKSRSIMDKAEFDKRFLALANQTDIEISAANVAYHLDLPIEETQEHLLALELNGILSQSVDDQGNTKYLMPSRAAVGTLPQHQLESGEAKQEQAPGIRNPADLPQAPMLSGKEHAPVTGKSVNGLVLNVIFPGLGSLSNGNMLGLAMMGLVLLGLLSLFFLPDFSKVFAIVPIIAAWIWSINSGIKMMDDREPTPN